MTISLQSLLLFAGQLAAGFAVADAGPQEIFRAFARGDHPVANRIPRVW